MRTDLRATEPQVVSGTDLRATEPQVVSGTDLRATEPQVMRTAAPPALPPTVPPESASNLFLCILLSTLGSLAYVVGIMSIAYPAHLVAKGRAPWSKLAQAGWSALYVLGTLGSVALPAAAVVYGPVAIQFPVYQGSMLLWNMLLMDLLAMATFEKAQRVGTFVIVFATLMLIDAGPTEREQLFIEYTHIPTMAWLLFLATVWIASTVGMIRDVGLGLGHSPDMLMAIYVVAGGIGTAATTTLFKLLTIESGGVLGLCCVLLAATGATNMLAALIAAKKLNQADFIPYAAMCALVLNQLTGLLVWEDWRTVTMWTTYIALHVIIGLGMYDLSKTEFFATVKMMPDHTAVMGGFLGGLLGGEIDTSDANLEALFARFDVDRNGSISTSEMRDALQTIYGTELDDKVISQIFAAADTETVDGQVDLSEFKKLMRAGESEVGRSISRSVSTRRRIGELERAPGKG